MVIDAVMTLGLPLCAKQEPSKFDRRSRGETHDVLSVRLRSLV